MTDHPHFPRLNKKTLGAALERLLQTISPEPPRRRTFEPARVEWNRRAIRFRDMPPEMRRTFDEARPYLSVHPEREIAYEALGMGYCPACEDWYHATLFEWILSPAFLRAQRWAHRHNAEHHPRRWLRSQHFQASIPVEVRERAQA
ncbi:hypothetical protein P2P98_13110 [Microbacterium sp. Kw_RZR3]|uniref:hypothetical protein n=1 Tax=Microbacterium sp. Kw_RZR3 TaxID=3032903 RepID=UPI0023DCC716|nr:hypothetical protein [Microbacterium sp. Kw_RZR3]MDF2047100.1 hypothetical protein [Microbacterium sp. Kw_RZR3]